MSINKLITATLLIAGLLSACTSKPVNTEGNIYINSLGYQPQEVKKVTLVNTVDAFNVIDAASGKSVFSGKAAGPFTQEDVSQTAYIADFSGFTEPGTYFIETQDGAKSATFVIANEAYNEAFYTAMRGFYLWRCGTAVEGVYEGDTFRQKACHLNDGYLDYTKAGNGHKNGTGGWHDAGDYGKYTVNTGISLGLMFMAWDNFEESLREVSLDIPNTADAYPDYLAELKWETDWLLKMQYPDNSGKIFHKLTRLGFSGFIMPSEDNEKRYFTEWGTSATAHFVGNTAQAARYFKPYNEAYAATCLKAAKNSYSLLKKHPEYLKWEQEEFSTGGYQCNDSDARLWAAAELWETTGEADYLADFEKQISEKSEKVSLNWDWGNIGNLGVFTYLLSEQQGKDMAIVESLSAALISIADTIVESTETDVYGRPFNKYYWGCNGTVARLSSTLYTAYKITGDEKYKAAGQAIVAHLFGRNVYGRSFVTGLGVNPPMHPHDRRCAADSIPAPWPGYIIGGGHTATDWIDEEASYSHNEIAINWQAALVYALAWTLTDKPEYTTENIAQVPSWFPVNFALYTTNQQQYIAYYDTAHHMTIASRNSESKAWKYNTLPSKIEWDSHNYLSLVLDSLGYIHLVGNMHSSQLVYFKSEKPYDIHTMSPIDAMVGTEEDVTTYPEFMVDKAGKLIFHYRYGRSGNGYEVYNYLDVPSQTWKRMIDVPLVDGENLRNAYITGPVMGPDGYYHMIWVWRDTWDCSTNHTLSYAKSSNLLDWESIRGEQVTLPITLSDSVLTVDNTPPKGGLINIGINIGFDSNKQPIISYHKYDSAGNTQVYITRYQHNSWYSHQITNWEYRWDFKGMGTITNELLLDDPFMENQHIIVGYHHTKYGDGQIVTDESSLEALETRDYIATYPKSIDSITSTFPGMLVNKVFGKGSYQGDQKYLLRWETLPPNRDGKIEGNTPGSSTLQLITY